MSPSIMLAAVLVAAASAAGAQAQIPTEFPDDAQPFTAETLRERVAGKVFKVKPADGSEWRLDYKANGYVFIDTNRGFRDSGTWKVEGTQVCVDWKRSSNGGCSEARLKGDTFYLKRAADGEVIVLMVQ